MKLWALGDLHLSRSGSKPMDVFGSHWVRHDEKIEAAWRKRVGADDIVLIPGDTSWGMKFSEARDDLEWIDSLPGARKVLIRGNHDYWWTTLRKLREAAPGSLEFLHNNALEFGPFVLAGTRGWDLKPPEGAEGDPLEREQFERIHQREIDRLERSLRKASELREGRERILVVLLHYPPLYVGMESSAFTEVIDRHSPRMVVYGHLHGGRSQRLGFQGLRGRTWYALTSADHLDFRPLLLHSGSI